MSIDWSHLLVPETPLVELFLRGTVMYLALLAAMRVLVRRHSGSLNLMDLLLVVLIADAAQNGMADQYRSITEAFVLCGTLIGWNYLLDFLAYRSSFVASILEPSPLPLVKDGRMLRRNLRQELMTVDELLSQLRQQEVGKIEEVKLAFLEPDGALSVTRVSSGRGTSKPHRSTTPGVAG
jgi:uncharacterized membrane protein YcaP (DUF421 family)